MYVAMRLAVVWRVLLPAVALASGGCQAMYFMTDPDQQKEVKAEYSKIGDRKMAVVVWADQATIDMYPRARQHVAKAVVYYISKNVPTARLVEPEAVEAIQARSRDWEGWSNRQLAEKLQCDLLLRIDLLDYTTRAGGARELRKGRVRGTLHLYDVAQDEGRESVYQSDVAVTYPPGSIHGVPDMNDDQMFHETVDLFGQMVARKFYDHSESLRGPEKR